jgi:hypothetical protein
MYDTSLEIDSIFLFKGILTLFIELIGLTLIVK